MKDLKELFEYIAISAGMALAASCFSLVSSMFLVSNGVFIFISILLAGFFCIIIAGSIGELASLFPSSPGISVYFKKAFGEKISLALVFLYVTLIAVLAGVESFIFSNVISISFFPDAPSYLFSVSILFLIIIANFFGLEFSNKIQTSCMILLTLGIFFISVLSIIQKPTLPLLRNGLQENLSEISFSLPITIGLSIFLFIGFEWVTPLGRNPKSYERLIPYSMPLTIILLTILYAIFCIALSLNFERKDISNNLNPQFMLAYNLYDNTGKYLAVILTLFAMVTSFNAGLMSSSRLIYGISREGNLPRLFSKISTKGVPIGAILLLGSIAVTFSVFISIFKIQVYALSIGAAIECVIYGFLIFALFRIRRTKLNRPDFQSPVPRWLQYFVGIIMPLLGISALFIDQSLKYFPVLIFCLLTIFCIGLAQISYKRER
ncbi:APC family permease [Leptospira santarosai]|uniref:APC family permease n=1 Tax=Leptospira santarosai TaxID=28183 RepID=UPI0002BF5073|nr:APC family permease [Leptospira santarosai]EMO73352.1 spore germination protein [Leptospira santarosai str. 200403458]EMO98215.1 spore germination protein [Leptospira santarosai str. 200702252]